MERPPGAGLPSPNIWEGSFSFPLVQFKGEAKSHAARDNTSSPREGNLPACSQLPQAPQQCAGGVCKKRWKPGSGGMAFQPCAALCWRLGRSTERLRAEASGQNEKPPHAGPFSVHLLQVCALHRLYLGISPHRWKSLCAARS